MSSGTSMTFSLFGRDVSASDALRRIGDNSKNAGRTIEKSMESAGKSLTTKLTLPLTALGALSIKTAGDFEQSMALLKVNTAAPAAELEKLRQLAIKTGQDTVFSASESATAMLDLAKSGLTPAQIAGGALQSTMAIAASEGLALSDAAVIASNAMNTFGLAAGDAASIADALAGGSVASSASVESLAQALSQVGPGATNAGLSLQETVGVLAAFDNAGIKGSDAGTSLKTMLARLVPQTDAAAAAMRDLGLDFTNADGSFVSVAEIAGQLQSAMGGLSEEQRTLAMNTIFGSDATRAATVFMKEGAAGIEAMVAATSEQGKAQELADARMAGWNGTLESLKGSLETAALAIGDALLPAAKSLAEQAKGLVDWFTGLSDGSRQLIVKIGALAAAIGPTVWIAAKAISAAKALRAAYLSVKAAAQVVIIWTKLHAAALRLIAGSYSLAGVKAKLYAAQQWVVSAAAKAWAAAQWLLNVALTMNPIGLVIAAIVALVAIFVLAWKNSETFRAIVTAAWNGIKAAALAVVNWFKNTAWPVIKTVIGFIAGYYLFLWNTVRNVFGWIKDRVASVFGWLQGTALPAVRKTMDTVRGVFAAAWDGIKKAWSGFTGFFRGLFDGIAGIARGAFRGVLRIVNTLIDGVNVMIRGFNKLPLVPDIATIPHVALASGGIVTGPTAALIGEAGPEAVIPLSRAGSMGLGGPSITVNVSGVVGDKTAVARTVVAAIDQAIQSGTVRPRRLAVI